MANTDDRQIFCNNVKQLRINKRLTQREMAKLLKIGVNSLRQLEQGKIPPRMNCEIILNIYRAFDLSPHQQFSPLNPMELTVEK